MVDWTNKSQRARFAACVTAVQAGNNNAAEELITAMKPAVLQLAKRYGHLPGADFDNLLQVGQIAVWEAAKSYDPSKGTSVATHCYNMIRWRMAKSFHKYRRDHILDNANSLTPVVAKNIPARQSARPEDAAML
ncbi:hypothetical protein LCGC14_2800950, partial [marine sediment metagenome]